MHYEDRVVCFLDILGFKNHISSSLNKDGTDDSQRIKSLASTFALIRNLRDDIDNLGLKSNKEVTQFSDSLVISSPSNKESGVFYTLWDILWMQIHLVFHGVLCRGGVVRGKMIHTSELLFGPAMLDAYELESKAALYPRVVLSEEIVNLGVKNRASYHSSHNEEQSILKLIKKDSDGLYYIDYITGAQSELTDPELDYPKYLGKLRNIIATGLASKSISVISKYSWLEEKFSPHLAQVKEAARAGLGCDDLRDEYERIDDL